MACYAGNHESPRFVSYDWVDGKRVARYTCGACGANWSEPA